MQDLTKLLMHEIDNGTKVKSAIEELFQDLNTRKTEINISTEEIDSVMTHVIEMLEVT